MSDSREKQFFYESFADKFDDVVNMYDTHKRVSVVFSELLPRSLKGKKVLDAGCGTGWFSAEATKRGATVFSMDVGENLLKKVKEKCRSTCVVGSILEIPFPKETFDIVISSEVIEHVPHPFKAISEMHRVLKPGGTLVITTPNSFWHWSVLIANTLHLRPYQGLENWISWGELKAAARFLKMEHIKMRGIHAFPFVLSATYPLLDLLDKLHPALDPYMVNMCISAQKKI